jgi:hypothetical protein
MKAVVAVAQVTAFASQFRRNIKLWDDVTEVPVNAISFVITGSGAGKDSSVKAARKCFKSGYCSCREAAYKKKLQMAIEELKKKVLLTLQMKLFTANTLNQYHLLILCLQQVQVLSSISMILVTLA